MQVDKQAVEVLSDPEESEKVGSEKNRSASSDNRPSSKMVSFNHSVLCNTPVKGSLTELPSIYQTYIGCELTRALYFEAGLEKDYARLHPRIVRTYFHETPEFYIKEAREGRLRLPDQNSNKFHVKDYVIFVYLEDDRGRKLTLHYYWDEMDRTKLVHKRWKYSFIRSLTRYRKTYD